MTSVTATYTTPYDWTTGETITEALLDAMNSNIMFLKTPTQSRLVNQAQVTTTSTSFVDLTGGSITKTTNAAKVFMGFTGTIAGSTTSFAVVTLLVDGTNQGDTTLGMQLANYAGATNAPFHITYPTDTLTAASHVFKVQWRVTAGTATLQAGWSFWMQEM